MIQSFTLNQKQDMELCYELEMVMGILLHEIKFSSLMSENLYSLIWLEPSPSSQNKANFKANFCAKKNIQPTIKLYY